MDLESFLARLPSLGSGDRPPLVTKDEGFDYHPEPFKGFVPPDLSDSTELGGENPESPAVLVISAPAAVGKSTLGYEISRRAGAPLWDLSKFKTVGSGSVTGAIFKTFGAAAAGNYCARLSAGKTLLVIDGLDEARIKVNEQAFHDFLADISALTRDAPAPAVVMLGRASVAGDAWLILTELGATVGLYRIDFFDEPRARIYVRHRLEACHPDAARAMHQHGQQFDQALDLLFDGLRNSVAAGADTEHTDGRDFLGYAPVLDAIAVLFDKYHNFAELRHRLDELQKVTSPGSFGPAPASFLNEVITNILRREAELKVQVNIRPVLAPFAQDWSDWDQLYRPEEQCERVLRRALDLSGEVSTPSIPGHMKPRYEEHISSFVVEHPFLYEGRDFASHVFAAYLVGWALTEGPRQLAAEVAIWLDSAAYKPLPILSDFYFLFAEHIEELPVVESKYLGYLYDSLVAGQSDQSSLDLLVDGPWPEEISAGDRDVELELQGEFSVIPHDKARLPIPIPFLMYIRPSTSEARFGRGLRDASITMPCLLSLDSVGADVRLEGTVFVCVDRLRVTAPMVVAAAATRGRLSRGAILEAREFDGHTSDRPVVHTNLRVSWPNDDHYPWTPYRFRPERPAVWSREMDIAYLRLHKILRVFQAKRGDQLARYRAKIDHRRVLKDEIGERMRDQLISDQILSARGSFYYADTDKIGKILGISWSDLDLRRVSDELVDYLEKFIQKNQSLFG